MKKLLYTLLLLLQAGVLVRAQEPERDTLAVPSPFVTDVTELLKGHVAGVEVISSLASPGMEPTVYIRGVGANPTARPLYVVDGVRVHSLEGLSPQDVESVEALRDASALTLYGPDAADGVIVIRTRRASGRGIHVAYEVDGLLQQPAWMPVAEKDSGTSFSHRHHLALQWGGDRLRVYAGVSYLDQNGVSGGPVGYRRLTGTWSLSWDPVSWLSVETSGHYGRGKGEDPYRFPNLLAGAASVTARPLAGLFLRAGAGYSQNGLTSVKVDWWDAEASFNGQNDRQTKWHWEAEAGYAVPLGNGHRLEARLSYRHRTEEYDLYSANGKLTLPASGVSQSDLPGFLRDFILPEMATLRSSDLKEWNHLVSASPYDWRWKWNELSARIGYAWEDRLRVDGALFRSVAVDQSDIDPLTGWSLNGAWNLWKGLFLRGSWGQTDRILLNGPFRYVYLLNANDVIISGGSSAVYSLNQAYKQDVFRSVRKEIGLDFRHRLGGDLSLSAMRFWNDDDACVYIPTNFGSVFCPPYTVLNRGWEFTGGWQGSSGDLRYAFGGHLTLYSNRIRMAEGKDAGFMWTDYVAARDGYSVGVNRLYQFGRDNYVGEGSTPRYVQPVGDEPAYHGGVMPSVSAGLYGMVGWNRWSFLVSGHGMGGNSIFTQTPYNALMKYYQDNYPDGGDGLMGTTAALFDGSFFRIDQLRLGYDLPLRRVGLNIGLYASLENFFLFTRYPGSDPEMALTRESFGMETATFPTSKRVVLGLKVGF